MERWIEEGRVSIDGRAAQLGDRIESHQVLRVDGHPLPRIARQPVKSRVLVYHKPEGELTTRSDPDGRATVFEHLPLLRHARWIAIGRLDMNTSGLLLFTTDGELAHRLMHPTQAIEREYAVRVLGEVSDAALQQLRDGVALDDGVARFETIQEAGGSGVNHWYHVTIKEGRYREVRRLWLAVGVRVSRLIRVRFGDFALPKLLREGRWRELDGDELKVIYAMAGMTPPSAPVAHKGRGPRGIERKGRPAGKRAAKLDARGAGRKPRVRAP